MAAAAAAAAARAVGRAFGAMKSQTEILPVAQGNPPTQQSRPLLVRLCGPVCMFAYRRRCGYLVGFILYMAVGVAFFLLSQHLSSRSQKGAYFQGTNGTSPTDATYFTVVSLSSIGFGDIYPVRKPAVVFVSIYIYLGVLFFSVASVILSGVMHVLEDHFISFCVRLSPWGQEEPAAQQEGPRLKARICIHFLLSLGFTGLLAIWGGFYVAVSAVTTVGFGNKSFSKGGDRVVALCLLFPAVLFYGRLGSLIGEYFGNPLPN